MEHHTYGPCATEDSTSCYWNAPTVGDGTGLSFIALPDGTTVPIDGCQPGEGLPAVDFDADGQAWAYCEPALGNSAEVYVPQAPTDAVTEHPVVSVPAWDTETLAVTGPTGLEGVLVAVALAFVGAGLLLTRAASRH